ncbi:hypothetical protein BDZ90DRAFT_231681 [Jaminaea rosea]|uniref:Helicase SWR1 n=1 Tax=Jaminaea rosea TaxID=1569628 RepID=A0A316USD8_9BASI|nr:hypothetical protein BDZ90DRAFT_231681 [Jaminaea rosea]PWN27904.1 hypothetical protein BDZ90DRAFT_231681 [Jaminaea rosea]
MADPHDEGRFASPSSSSSSPAPVKKRRLELDGLKFDNPGAAFDFAIDSSHQGRPARRTASLTGSARASPAVGPSQPSREAIAARTTATTSAAPITSKRQRRPSSKLRDDYDGLVIRSSPPSSSTPRRKRTISSSQPVAGPSTSKPPRFHPTRGDTLDRLQQELDDIHCDHDEMVRELFHLSKFVTYVGYDPAIAKEDRSHVFEHFRAEHGLDLESKLARRATRRIVSSRMDDLSLRKARPSDVKGKGKADEDAATPSKKQPRRSSPVKAEQPAKKKKTTKARKQGEDGEEEYDEAFLLELWQRRQRQHVPPPIPPLLAATSYKQVPEPYDFGSVDAFWGSFRMLGNDEREDWDPEETERWEQREADLYTRIDAARAEGRLLDQPASTTVLRPLKEPQLPSISHVDHIAQRAHAVRSEAKQRRAVARKAARAIQTYWQSRQGEGERERKAQERHLRTLARWTVREVNKQWKLAVSVVRAQKAKQEKLDRERAGREQLSMILERSTQYLGQREEDLRQGRILSDAGSEAGDDESEASTESDVYSVEDDGSAASDDDRSQNGEPETRSTAASSQGDTNHMASLVDVNGHEASDGEEDHRHRSLRRLIEDASGDSVSRSSRERSSPPTSTGRPPAIPESPEAEPVPSPLGTRFGKHQPNGINGDGNGIVELTGGQDGDASNSNEQAINGIADDHSRPFSKANGEVNGHVDIPPSPSAAGSNASVSAGEEEEDDDDEGENIGRRREDAQLEQEMRDEDEEDESEDDGLLADADVPIEELMRRYGYGAANGETSEAESEESEDEDQMEEDGESSSSSERESESSTAREDVNGTTVSQNTSDAASISLAKVGANAPALHQPFLLRGNLRPYQQTGFEWLASLYANSANGILADEMGLGKTIQTISLLAHLACDRGVWGPHLVIAPTSVMLNWEVEFKKFLPGFKILSYYGSQRERKEKRIGWNTEHSFNVCITSYQLVLADQHIFRRKPWVYMILDEAHHIKNFRSQRWQTLLGFNSQRRLLLTGTPLQNNLMDLWSLMYFLMPNGLSDVAGAGAFANMKDFQEWFSNPLDRAVEAGSSMDEETKKMVAKLHTILRPFLLRRLKSEVEQELPRKYEHVLRCRLSKRQRFLYNDFMSRAKTKESLASGSYMSIINCLMQLRKVCNHPDLFEVRPIATAFAMEPVAAEYSDRERLVRQHFAVAPPDVVDGPVSFDVTSREQHLTPVATRLTRRLDASDKLPYARAPLPSKPPLDMWTIEGYRRTLNQRRHADEVRDWKAKVRVNRLRCAQHPTYGRGLLKIFGSMASTLQPFDLIEGAPGYRRAYLSRCSHALRLVSSLQARSEAMAPFVDRFAFVPPRAMAKGLEEIAAPGVELSRDVNLDSPLHRSATKLQIAFPDASLLQYDCGKLQELERLMSRLKDGGHRILIFTQMTRVLDILEAFLNLHGYRYLRLDGATRVDRRQALTEKFNRDTRIDAFILSTRSGGLGINLTGADTVLFYDLDWNSAIEAQCMDRAHRIGQTRDVHIYRFVSEATIEENMLKKADQKRLLDSVVVGGGDFTTERLKRGDWRDMLDDGGKTLAGVAVGGDDGAQGDDDAAARAIAEVEDEEDQVAAEAAREEMVALDDAVTDFREESRVEAADDAGEEAGNEARVQIGASNETQVQVEGAAEEEEDEEGTVDDYMLRFVERDWSWFTTGFKV